jgi:hypothetical protein
MSFFPTSQRTGKQNKYCLEVGYQWEEGGYKERVWEGAYGGNILYTCM